MCLGLLRCGKSCRLRWINYLRADLKRGNITSEEEDVIIKLHASLGNRYFDGQTFTMSHKYFQIKQKQNVHFTIFINI